ncbi:Transmembrane 9 superfamily member 4 [Hypsibius exemplaris]|uniref:Transmembrane 9 superfamily member n=1 Tax=Hypsibius exemplaris TaxID=2072580 RepID=A0A1W0X6E2_HYPEX|nr:Transmembrane 9 superfamily member 4 [Hypsibius exemplaris]
MPLPRSFPPSATGELKVCSLILIFLHIAHCLIVGRHLPEWIANTCFHVDVLEIIEEKSAEAYLELGIFDRIIAMEIRRRWLSGVLCILFIASLSEAIVPGVAPVEFHDGDLVEVKAVKMTSEITQLPYEYYSLPICRPKEIEYKTENFGELLRGDRVVSTPFKIIMGKDEPCNILCKSDEKSDQPISAVLTAEEGKTIGERIREAYFVHLLVDNLPCATKFAMLDNGEPQYEPGYRLGYVRDNKAYLNNHLKLILKYHEVDDSLKNRRIVGCEIEAVSVSLADYSISNAAEGKCNAIPDGKKPLEVNEAGETKVLFTYAVHWEASDVRWAYRWDVYLKHRDVQIHWFSIVNSLIVVLFLAGILSMIIVRTLRRDIAQYNRDDLEGDEAIEETGWKLVHGDVFRAPPYTKFFCSLVATGVQLMCMAFVTIFVAMLGMLSPASRGSLMQAGILLYVFSGSIGGYHGGRLYKTFKGVEWKRTALITSVLYPGIVFGTCFFLNFFIWGKQSSGAVPFTTMLALLCLWFGVSLPLIFVGYYFGYRKQPYENPVRTNQIPRQVPDQVWYLSPTISTLMAGILPFGALFVELFFLMNAIWLKQYYYLFGFLFLVFIILIISVSIISIVMVYFQLCGENYRWWWRSLLVSGGVALYVLAYSVFYFVTKLEITGFIPTLLYFGYTLLMVITVWILTGTIGFYAAYFFISRIYGAVKID